MPTTVNDIRRSLSRPLTLIILLVALIAISLVLASGNDDSVAFAETRGESDAMMGPAATDDVVTLSATDDATIQEAAPDVNYGTIDQLLVERDDFLYQYISLLKFDLTSIPPGSTINGAELRLNLEEAYVGFPTVPIGVAGVTSNWHEDSVTWNTAPAWACCASVTDVGSTSGTVVAWNVTGIVDGWVNDGGVTPNFGVALIGPSDHHHRAFASRETTNAPQLVVDVTFPAPDGAIRAAFHSAKASLKNNDDPLLSWEAPEDFFPKISVNGGPLVIGPTISERSFAKWAPFSTTASVIKAVQFYSVTFELWEDDDIGSDEEFDISPDSDKAIHARYDGCTQTFTIGSGADTYGPGKVWVPREMPVDLASHGQVLVEISNVGGKSFAPDDVSIIDAQPVQVAYDARAMVAGKATSLMAELSSSWSMTRNVEMYAMLSDGTNTVTQTKTVTVPPAGLKVFLFDGSGGVDPFLPQKTTPDNPLLTYFVEINIEGEAGGFPWFDCVDENNSVEGTLPILQTRNPTVVYRAWDFDDTRLPPSVGNVAATRNTNEIFRLATFPIPVARAVTTPPSFTPYGSGTPIICLLLPVPADLCNLPFFVDELNGEPGQTLVWQSLGASAAGIGRLVLMPRQTFWENNQARLAVGGAGTLGLSLGEFLPHAVIAEAGTSQTVVHELGHTYTLSQHPCSTGGIWEDLFNIGCRDEYNHAAADGRPYLASGFDVLGAVYPTGSGGVAGTREVDGVTNLMDTTGTLVGAYDRWIDSYSYNILLDEMRNAQDPALISVTGFLWAENGLDTAESELYGVMFNSYQFEGIPDMVELPLDEPSGNGAFSVHLETGTGDRIYRFNPRFLPFDEYGDYAFFSFNVEWDPELEGISLWGPDVPLDPQTYQEMELFSQARTIEVPEVTALRAGLDKAPDLDEPQNEPPSIPFGHDVVLAWDASDADSAELRTILLLQPPDSTGIEYGGWLPYAVELDTDQFTIPSAWLADRPGTYNARVLVSDGINTVTYEQTASFIIEPSVQLFLPLIQDGK